jgi:hypothetical protein
MKRRTRLVLMVSMVAGPLICSPANASAQTTAVRCESVANNRKQCPIAVGVNVVLSKHLSETPCTQGTNWGVGQGFIWVTGGCRAEFTVTGGGTYPPPAQSNENATVNQLRACRTEVDRRLANYTYDQIVVADAGRQGNVSRVRWRAGSTGGTCAVTSSGRVVDFKITPTDGALIPEGGDTAGTGQPAPDVGAAPATLTCESRTGGRQECPIAQNGPIKLTRQLSQSPCRLNDTYGTGAGYVWVDKGCRGEFRVLGAGPGTGAGAGGGFSRTVRVVCESQKQERTECKVAGATSVKLVQQRSLTPCSQNRSFGVGFGHIWVSNGCRGEFDVTVGGGQPGPGVGAGTGTGLPERITCESDGGERNTCAIRKGAAVKLVRQLSTAPCSFARTWGTGDGVIWVARGCRAEFEVR